MSAREWRRWLDLRYKLLLDGELVPEGWHVRREYLDRWGTRIRYIAVLADGRSLEVTGRQEPGDPPILVFEGNSAARSATAEITAADAGILASLGIALPGSVPRGEEEG